MNLDGGFFVYTAKTIIPKGKHYEKLHKVFKTVFYAPHTHIRLG